MGSEERESIDAPIRRLLGEHRQSMAFSGARPEHVDDETLARHAAGDLSATSSLEVAKHLATCDADCAERLREHAASIHAAREALYPEAEPTSAIGRRQDAAALTESTAPPKVSERTHPGKSVKSFVARDVLWEIFEQMARELECSVDYLMNESMKHYARHRSYGSGTPFPGRASVPPGPAAPSYPPPAAAKAEPAPYSPRQQLQQSAIPPPPLQPGPMVTPVPMAAAHAPASLRTPAHTPVPPPVASRPSGPPPLPPTSRPSGPPPMSAPLSMRPTIPVPPPSYGGPPPMPYAAPPPPPPPAMGAPRAMSPVPFPAPRPPAEAMQGYAPPPMMQHMQQPQQPGMGYGQMPPPPAGALAPPALAAYYAGQRHPVVKDRFIIGRGKNTTDLTVRDPNISRQHAMVELSDGVYYMVDLGSTNGVEHTGQRISRKAIVEGDLFVICGHEIRFTYR